MKNETRVREVVGSTVAPWPEEDVSSLKLVSFVPSGDLRGERVAKLISSPFCVSRDVTVTQLAEEWQGLRGVEYLGVVDGARRPVGLISREDFFTSLGKPFGMEILGKKRIEEVCIRDNRILEDRMSLFQLSDEDDALGVVTEDVPCLVTDRQGCFQGVFTTRDFLLYLSRMTQRDILLARGLQNRIVPGSFYRDSPFMELCAGTKMAKGVGGDFFFYQKLEGGKHFWTLCDVSGKGVSASLVTAFLWGIVSSYTWQGGLENLIDLLNERLIQAFAQERFVTGLFFVYDPEKGKLTIADIGHGYFYIYRGDSLQLVPAGSGNMPLGVVENLCPQLRKLSLQPDDVVVALSDGLVEQTNPQGYEYPLDRLSRLIKVYKNKAGGWNELDQAILGDFRLFRGSQPQHDDTSFSLMRVLG